MVARKFVGEDSAMRFLKKLREDRGLTKYGMAKFLDMIPNTYTHYEEKAEGIKLEVLVDIKRRCGLTWEQLGKMLEKEVE